MSVKTNPRYAVLAGALLVTTFGLYTPAQAALMVSYNGGTPIVDNGAGDSDLAVGRIVNSSTVAGFGIAITVGTSNSPGSASGGVIQVSSLNIQNASATPASLNVRVSDTGFTNPGAAGSPMILTSSFGGTFTGAAVGNTASFQSFADPANSQPANVNGTPVILGTKLNPALPTESFSGLSSIGFVRAAGAYSISDSVNVTLSAGGQANVSGTSTVTVFVPEPATLAALSGVALFARRRRA